MHDDSLENEETDYYCFGEMELLDVLVIGRKAEHMSGDIVQCGPIYHN